MKFSTTITIDGATVIINVPRDSPAWRKANAIFCPAGPAPMRGWFLMLKSDLDGLSINSAHAVTWGMVDDSGTVTTLTFPGLYIVSAERLLHGGVGDANAIFLVELADGRMLADRNSDSGVVLANIRSYANSADYLTGADGKTWSSLCQSLWATCPTLGAYPGLPGTLPIDGVPQNTTFAGINAYRALTAVLDQLDCAIVRDPFSATFSIVQLGDSTTPVPDESSTLKWNGEPKSINVTQAAAYVAVYHHEHYKCYGQERDTELATNWAATASGVSPIATGITGAQGTTPLWDDLPLIRDENHAFANLAESHTRDQNRALRYATRMSVTNQHRMHYGLLSTIVPGGLVRAVLWRNWDDGDESDFGGTVTEFACCPQLIYGLKQGSDGEGAAWLDDQLGAPERENYLPPDLGRHTFPSYPRLPNLVQVWHSTEDDSEPIGDILQPLWKINATGTLLHSGRVRRFVSGGLAILDPCFILFVDDFDTLKGNVPALENQYYGPARLSGVATANLITEEDAGEEAGEEGDARSEMRPVYTVYRGLSEATALVTLHTANGSGSLQVGALGLDLFIGFAMTERYVEGEPAGGIGGVRLCVIQFTDFSLSGSTVPVIAEYRRIYGPAKYSGEYDLSAVGLGTCPIYQCSIGEQEWQGKGISNYGKGATGSFVLYDDNDIAQSIVIDAVCKYNAYSDSTKYARIKRSMSAVIANQVEC